MSLPVRARVLIVDDSITMRAFFGAIFERVSGIEVVGTASSAAEARKLMIEKRPNVITLDVEMPGMSGLEFLGEIMRDRPTPVIMLSSLTQKGAETSFKALELGAVDCFPKPSSTNRDEFAAKLSALVIAAATGNVRFARYAIDAPARPAVQAQPAPAGYDWNGKVVLMSTSTGGVDALLQLLPSFPVDCPPVVVNLQIEPEFVPPLLKRLKTLCHARVLPAEDGRALRRGEIQIVTDAATHAVLDRWPEPSLRLINSNPVNGVRPSASLLFATAAKTAGVNAVGVMLTGMGADGVAGLKALRATGAHTISQDSLTCLVDQAPAAAREAGVIERDLPLDQIVGAILENCRRIADAA
ncbi:chemotaxis-specific protein-glutamate methyltransferase CheB [Sphingomonas sp. SRS2]|uniref:chemotaxis-specific protein-glutamate methyltransferase CheB n=1 Tax=Sphingomonas sp. SRS2 TaxID=133190 RepID=UPI0006184B6B|nr:chemotaxis-specific protein-glutamate methyltransferase CheB [Sphingomonas sp. SRS2]KKC27575.1 chemotaxis protein CheB [Sphingomonas sp. SRS2]